MFRILPFLLAFAQLFFTYIGPSRSLLIFTGQIKIRPNCFHEKGSRLVSRRACTCAMPPWPRCMEAGRDENCSRDGRKEAPFHPFFFFFFNFPLRNFWKKSRINLSENYCVARHCVVMGDSFRSPFHGSSASMPGGGEGLTPSLLFCIFSCWRAASCCSRFLSVPPLTLSQFPHPHQMFP